MYRTSTPCLINSVTDSLYVLVLQPPHPTPPPAPAGHITRYSAVVLTIAVIVALTKRGGVHLVSSVLVFDVHTWICAFRIIKTTRCTNFSILFWNETLHVSGSSSVHHQEFFIVHTAMINVIPVCGQLASRIRMEHTDSACKLSANRYDIYHCCVYSGKLLMMDRGTARNM
jgi:hypothetical protein